MNQHTRIHCNTFNFNCHYRKELMCITIFPSKTLFNSGILLIARSFLNLYDKIRLNHDDKFTLAGTSNI